MNQNYDIIYCPFLEVDVIIGSDLLEKIGSFSLFLISSVAKGISLETISAGTGLELSNVIETARELTESGLMSYNDHNDRYTLTDLGITYGKIKRFIDFNSKESEKRYAVNCFTGRLEDVNNTEFFDYHLKEINQEITLPQKISRILLKSPNYENVKEYMKSKINISNISITNDDYDYIYYTLKDKHNLFYVPYIVLPESYTIDSDDLSKLILKIPVSIVRTHYQNKKVEQYKDALDKLNNIFESWPELLSEEAHKLLNSNQLINKWNSEAKEIYMDCYSGSRLRFEICDQEITLHERDKFVLNLSERSTVKEGSVKFGTNPDDYRVFEQKKIRITREIGFSNLRQLT